MGFYDQLADEYDTIVNTLARVGAARKFADWLLAGRAVQRVMDVACGTGLYARVFASRGLDVTAADVSGAMIAKARHTPPAQGESPIHWLTAPMQAIDQHAAGPFDAVLCMGNSLPHLLEDADLAASLVAFRRVLVAGGVAVIQLLNYDRILAAGERIVGITRHGGADDTREYVRFYDFLDGRVRFNILGIRWGPQGCEHELHQTELRPYRPAEVREALLAAGFARVELFGSLDGQPFDPAASDTVTVVGSR